MKKILLALCVFNILSNATVKLKKCELSDIIENYYNGISMDIFSEIVKIDDSNDEVLNFIDFEKNLYFFITSSSSNFNADIRRIIQALSIKHPEDPNYQNG